MIFDYYFKKPICSLSFHKSSGYDNVEIDLHCIKNCFFLFCFSWDFSWRDKKRKMPNERKVVKLSVHDARIFFDKHFTGKQSEKDRFYNMCDRINKL